MNFHSAGFPVYVRVSHDGRLSRDDKMTVVEAHDANFVVIVKDGEYVVWKDRYGDHGRVLTRAEADSRAQDHVQVCLGTKSAKSMFSWGKS